jgi:hypothetical protein
MRQQSNCRKEGDRDMRYIIGIGFAIGLFVVASRLVPSMIMSIGLYPLLAVLGVVVWLVAGKIGK